MLHYLSPNLPYVRANLLLWYREEVSRSLHLNQLSYPAMEKIKDRLK